MGATQVEFFFPCVRTDADVMFDAKWPHHIVLITLPKRIMCLIVSIQVVVAKGSKRQGRKKQFFSNISSNS